jgi:SAM-dependent methyltransferase
MSDQASIAAVARYWNRHADEARAEPGTRARFETLDRQRYALAPHIQPFADFPRWNDRRVLEIGCGLGEDAACFVRAGAEYTGIDISLASVKLARRRLAAYGLDANIVHGDAERLSEHVRHASFDLVYAFDVLHHTPNPDEAIRQARRAIRPDGEFRLMLHARESWSDAMIEAGFEQPETDPDCPVARSYSRAEARALLRANDFSATEITQDHIFPYQPDAFARGEKILLPWFAAMPPGMFRALERRFGRHMLIVAKPA